MKIMRKTRRLAPRHGQSVILFAVGEQTFAAAASDVDEIRDLHGLIPVGDATRNTSVAKVKFFLERNHRRYYVVDAGLHFRGLKSVPTRLVVLREHPIAVLVDSIDRMTEISTLHSIPKSFCGQERDWYSGLALLNEKVVPVVKMPAFLTMADQAIAKSIASRISREASA